MDYTCSDFKSVDSSSRFLYSTDRQTNRHTQLITLLTERRPINIILNMNFWAWTIYTFLFRSIML